MDIQYLRLPDIWALEVRVEKDVKVEGRLLAGVVHAHVEVQLLLAQDYPVRDSEVMLPLYNRTQLSLFGVSQIFVSEFRGFFYTNFFLVI